MFSAEKEPWAWSLCHSNLPYAFSFSRKLKLQRLSPSDTHPNHFWPGHLLDKLRLYLPTVAKDQSLAIFSCVEHKPPAYPAIYHSKNYWPMKDFSYMTHAYYDANKVYSIN
jgi:hypothetical protein